MVWWEFGIVNVFCQHSAAHFLFYCIQAILCPYSFSIPKQSAETPHMQHLTLKIYIFNIIFIYHRAYADAGPSVQHSEQPDGEGADFVKDTDSGTEGERSVEASSGDEEAKDEGGEGKKKKARSGFRDRKVINTHAHRFGI